MTSKDCYIERFLEGVVRVDLFPVDDSKISIPFNVPNTGFSTIDCDFTEPFLSICLDGDEAKQYCAESLSVKTTGYRSAFVTYYTHEISVNAVYNAGNLYEILNGDSYHVLLHTDKGDSLLAIPLDGTFQPKCIASRTTNSNQSSITISMTSNSPLIAVL